MSKLSQYLNQHLVGEVIVEPETRQKFATDNGPLEYLPEMVVYPYSTSDIRKLTLFAWQLAQKGHRLSITPRGGGTNGTGAAIGSGAVLALTKHMNSMLEFDAKQRLVRLQPGMSFEALRAALALQEMELPAFASAPSDATIGGALADGRDAVGRDQLRDRNAGHRGQARQRHHRVAMPAQHEAADVGHRHVQLHGDEGAHAGRVEHAGHANHALAGEFAQAVHRLRHGIQRIGHGNDDAVGRVLDDLRRDVLHDLVVDVQQIVTAHPRFARKSRGNDDRIGICGVLVIVRARNREIVAFDRA